MSKQTATDYLIQEIKNDTFIHSKSTKEWNEVFRIAKQMEREQIVKVWNDGNYNYFYNRVGRKEFEDGNEYYNETYGGKDE